MEAPEGNKLIENKILSLKYSTLWSGAVLLVAGVAMAMRIWISLLAANAELLKALVSIDHKYEMQMLKNSDQINTLEGFRLDQKSTNKEIDLRVLRIESKIR